MKELVGAPMLIIKSHKKFNCLSFGLLFFLPLVPINFYLDWKQEILVKSIIKGKTLIPWFFYTNFYFLAEAKTKEKPEFKYFQRQFKYLITIKRINWDSELNQNVKWDSGLLSFVDLTAKDLTMELRFFRICFLEKGSLSALSRMKLTLFNLITFRESFLWLGQIESDWICWDFQITKVARHFQPGVHFFKRIRVSGSKPEEIFIFLTLLEAWLETPQAAFISLG